MRPSKQSVAVLIVLAALATSEIAHAEDNLNKPPTWPSAPAAPGDMRAGPLPPPWPAADPQATRDSAILRARALQVEIAELSAERAQYGIAWPIVALGVGAGVAMYGGLVFLLADTGCNDPYTGSQYNGCSGNSGLKTFAAGAAIGGLALGIGGAVVLINRTGERRRLGDQINRRKFELRQVEQRMRFGFSPTPHGAALALGWSF